MGFTFFYLCLKSYKNIVFSNKLGVIKMIIKVHVIDIYNEKYLHIKFKNIDKEEIVFSAEIKKKSVFEKIIRINDLKNNEFICKFNVNISDMVWFYYYYDNKKYFVKNIKKESIEFIDSKKISKFVYMLSKEELLEKIVKVGGFK